MSEAALRAELQKLPAFLQLSPTDQDDLVSRLQDIKGKTRELFLLLAQDLGKPRCSQCLSNVIQTSQLAKLKQNLLKAGFDIPRAEMAYCKKQDARTSHYTLVSLHLHESTVRAGYSGKEWKIARGCIPDRDAFDGAYAEGAKLKLDHRVPVLRLPANEQRIDVTDPRAVNWTFQKLTRTHNLQKSRACEACQKTGLRQPWLQICVFFAGDRRYAEDLGCWGCPWAYPEIAKAYLNKKTPPREELEAMTVPERIDLLMECIAGGSDDPCSHASTFGSRRA